MDGLEQIHPAPFGEEISEALNAPPIDCGWSAHPDASRFTHRYSRYRRPLLFQVGHPENRCDAYAVSPGMIMAVVDVGCTRTFESALSGQDIVEFHYRMSGSIELEGSWGNLCVREPSCLLWYQPLGCDDAAERLGTHANARETWVSLYCDRSWLYQICGLDAAALLERFDCNSDSREPQFRTTSRIASMVPLLKEIVSTPRAARTNWLMTIARAHELLHVTLRDGQLIDRHVEDRLPASRDRDRLQRAHDILAKEFAAPPTLPDLAQRCGINTSRLCSGFKLLFGETTSEYVRRQRLEFAHTLLTTTELQVREIARRSGYAHHGTFTAAFNRHFGFAPKAVRRA